MKAGDLVRHVFDGSHDDVGIVLDISRGKAHSSIGLVKVYWSPESSHSNSQLYRIRMLEVVSEDR